MLRPPRSTRRFPVSTQRKSSLMSASGRMAVFVTVIATPSFLGGCQMGRTYVLGMAPAAPSYTHVVIREADSMMKLSDVQRTHFEKQLAVELARAPHPPPIGSGEGQPLLIEYRLILHDAGSSATRVGAAVVSLTGIPTGRSEAHTSELQPPYEH